MVLVSLKLESNRLELPRSTPWAAGTKFRLPDIKALSGNFFEAECEAATPYICKLK